MSGLLGRAMSFVQAFPLGKRTCVGRLGSDVVVQALTIGRARLFSCLRSVEFVCKSIDMHLVPYLQLFRQAWSKRCVYIAIVLVGVV